MRNIDLEQVEEEDLFARCINMLLSKTAILQERDEKLFRFLKRAKNLTAVREYFAVIGWDIHFDEIFGYCMRVPGESLQEEMPGVLQTSKLSLSNDDVIVLVVLTQFFSENLTSIGDNFITQSQLIMRLKEIGVDIGKTQLSSSLVKFKKNSLIYFDETNKADENLRIDLYPTLRFCWDEEAAKLVVDEVMEGLNE